jgi:hypothetical protein
LLEHIDVLPAYEEAMQEQEPEPLPQQLDKQKQAEHPNPSNPSKSKLDKLTPNKDREKMLSMERQIQDPLKHMKQKQATESKL